MTAYILRVEGVDFDATVDDTHNLSAYRGGSLALLAVPCAVRDFLQSRGVLDSEIFIGASQGAWIVKVADEYAATMLRVETEAFLRAGGDKGPSAVFPHLSFVVDVAAGGDYAALKQAEAHNRARQLRHSNWALPEFVESAKGPNNKLDRMRPAPPACRVDAKGANDKPVSPSFKTRFEYGRDQRQSFYRQEAGETAAHGLDFARSFEDIVDEAPRGIVTSLTGKIAVFYADGNKFGKVREKANSIEGIQTFSNYLRERQRNLLVNCLDWLRAGAGGEYWDAYLQFPRSKRKEKIWPLRFETLLWGGDELIFVMPAWLGVEFAHEFFAWTKDWAFGGERLTFGAGLVFCHGKTPIRQARKMAKRLADDGKKTLDGALENALQIEVFESIALPEYENGLAHYREAMFSGADEKTLARWLTLRGEGIAGAFDGVAKLRNGAFPRSQLYGLLRKAAEQKLFPLVLSDETNGDRTLEQGAKSYFRRMGLDADEGLLNLGVLGNAPLAYSLAFTAALWDYVEPLPGADTPGERTA